MKNSKKKVWFRAKKYGWGWYPSTWQGWAIVLFYIVWVAYRAEAIAGMFDTQTSFAWRFLFEFSFATLVLIIVSYIKGEKPGWHWGDK